MLLLLLISSCDRGNDTPNDMTTLEPTLPVPSAESNAADADDSLVQENAVSTGRPLLLWLNEISGLGIESTTGTVLTDAFHQFEQQTPGLQIDVQIKSAEGNADLLNYLRSSQVVAPSILPDVILINTQNLWQIVDLGLVPALSASEQGDLRDLYPFALDAVTYRDQVFGIPYAASIVHTVYKQPQVATMPTTWNELFTTGQPYLYPMNGGDIFQNCSILLQYVGAGGQLMEEGTVTNPEALEAVFEFVTEGRFRGVLPEESLEIATYHAAWTTLVESEAGLADLSNNVYLTQRDSLIQTGFAQTPTRNGAPITIANTWSFAILTQDPEQRQVALGLVEYLLSPTIHGEWSQQSRRLPTQRAALQVWNHDDPYTQFLNQQLEIAVALPNGRPFNDFARRVYTAQIGVFTGELTPQQAAQNVRLVE